MPELLDRLVADHNHLLRLLDLFDGLLNRFRDGSGTDYDLLCEMVEYMESYANKVHEPSEEVIFDRLRARDNQYPAVLDELSRQHLALAEMNKRFRRSLEGIINEEVLRRDDVEAYGRELVESLRDHIVQEEEQAFPLFVEQLSASDWDELLEAVPSVEDPVFGVADRARFRTLFLHLEEQAQFPASS